MQCIEQGSMHAAGAVVRKSLAQALRTEGRLMVGVVEVLTGEVGTR